MTAQQNPSNELYNLRWNSYFTNLVNVFTDHQNQESLVDVTLSCEGQFIKAHRLILSACSVYFQKIFENYTAPHLCILLNDVKFKDLELVIQFMYKGEVKVADSDMQQLLALGKMLQVKGLCSVELQDKQKTLRTDCDNSTKVSETKQPEAKKDTKEPPQTSKKRKLPSPLPQDSKKKTSKPSSPVAPEDTSHIPRPPNAFMIFANQWRKKLAVEYPDESNKDISVRLGNMWKSLSPETKDAFYEDARKADEEHKQKYPGYYYSPKEARHRKAIATINKTAQKIDSSSDSNEPEFIEIKCEDESDNTETSTLRSNGTNP